jgi:hypothetical protein
MKDPMKKFNKAELEPVYTPMGTTTLLGPDEDGESVDQREYKSMIVSLLYLTATQPDIQFTVCLCVYLTVTQPDIQFTVCLCVCFQAPPHSSQWTIVQWIFRYLKHTLEFGI